MEWSKWAFRALCKLWVKHKRKYISFEDIKSTLNLDDRSIGVILSNLKKLNWVNSKIDPSNPRRKLYKLESLNKVIDDIAK